MRPRVAITVGDPAGIGPEIALKAAGDARVLAACEPVLFAPETSVGVAIGRPSAESGRAAHDVIVKAVAAAQRGDVDAIATAPISKLALSMAGLPWKGHTDLLAHLCRADRYAMLFYSPGLIVVLATVHVPLAQVPRLLTREHVTNIIALTSEWMPRVGVPRPRIALAGLNPHAGEAGVLGGEEEAALAPAVAASRARGIE